MGVFIRDRKGEDTQRHREKATGTEADMGPEVLRTSIIGFRACSNPG